ncbi:MAG: DUF6527 family protein [Pseudohongiellaceae bacterium]
MANSISNIFRWLFGRKHYKTQWVDDLPDNPEADTIYVVGGRKHPYRVVMVCPNTRCNHLVYLDVFRGADPKWRLFEHADGSLSLAPSVFLTGAPCRSHYWIRMGSVVWTPPAWVYRFQRRRHSDDQHQTNQY